MQDLQYLDNLTLITSLKENEYYTCKWNYGIIIGISLFNILNTIIMLPLRALSPARKEIVTYAEPKECFDASYRVCEHTIYQQNCCEDGSC
jgi:hypothetical protein